VSPLSLFAVVEAEISALKLLDQVDEVVEFNPIIRRICGVLLVKRNLMEIGIVKELLKVSELYGQPVIDGAVNASDGLRGYGLEDVDVSLNARLRPRR